MMRVRYFGVLAFGYYQLPLSKGKQAVASAAQLPGAQHRYDFVQQLSRAQLGQARMHPSYFSQHLLLDAGPLPDPSPALIEALPAHAILLAGANARILFVALR